MKKHLAKLAVVAVALVGVLSAQSEAAVAVAHHGGAKVHRVDKHHHKKVVVRKDRHNCRHNHGILCFFFGCH
ncbi:MAG: hypothetical protein IKV82_08155 [Akkermansia sp.]|nr:hypothetical protein [Akkermansia sp.]